MIILFVYWMIQWRKNIQKRANDNSVCPLEGIVEKEYTENQPVQKSSNDNTVCPLEGIVEKEYTENIQKINQYKNLAKGNQGVKTT